MENKQTIDIPYPECLPPGITEEKFIEIVQQVSKTPSYKFSFGYYSIEDCRQQAFVLAITFLSKGKFKPRGEKPMEVQLRNFLSRWIWNRLNNLRRDKCCKYPNPGGNNQTKFNLMYALPIYSQELATSEIFARDSNIPDDLSGDEVKQRILAGLNKQETQLYWDYLDEKELEIDEYTLLYSAIKRILSGEPEEYV